VEYRIDFTKISKDDFKDSLDTYSEAKLQEYQTDNKQDSNLWELFQENFEAFIKDEFDASRTNSYQAYVTSFGGPAVEKCTHRLLDRGLVKRING
jgi:hypothetical protein